MREKLRRIRIQNNYTQQQVATAAKISRPFYTKIELGINNPSLKVAIDIKKVFNYKGDDIFLNCTCQKGTQLSKIV